MVNEQPSVVRYMPAGKTIQSFMRSDAFLRAIQGPLGSGKSTACVIEILRRAAEQAPGPDGIRRSRWAIIRGSYPQLRSTTIKTWSQWCPPQFGRLTFDSPISHHIKTADMDMEVLFLALDKPEDVKKLLSLELTGAWVNEARELSKDIIDALTGRVGRFPARMQGGCTWSGIILDTNPPDQESWWFKAAELDTPKGWEFFKQPAGDGPDAENLENLPPDYYGRISAGKSDEWIACYIKGDYSYVTEGRAVFSMYRDGVHCAKEPIKPMEEIALFIGADFGISGSAAIIGQRTVEGRWLILDELYTENLGVVRFAEQLKAYVAQNYPSHIVGAAFGDPAGNQRALSDERTALQIMRTYTKWKWNSAPTNDLTMRLEVVRASLNRMVDGRPGFLLSPKCSLLRRGMSGGYHFKILRSGDGTQTQETPNKNKFSHPCDALEYLLLGAGEVNVVMNKPRRGSPFERLKPRFAQGMDYDLFKLSND